jgi:hypothetical protein
MLWRIVQTMKLPNTVCNFLRPSVTSCPFGPNILLSSCSEMLSVYQVSYPYKEAGKTSVTF